ncbi:hypothetical protein [Desulfitobacterium sp.]|nr:hypothetical protein [Desulfitobacterium sp.]HVJ50147.1 hypothetical protein [Desulfitobacterium sp.]
MRRCQQSQETILAGTPSPQASLSPSLVGEYQAGMDAKGFSKLE